MLANDWCDCGSGSAVWCGMEVDCECGAQELTVGYDSSPIVCLYCGRAYRMVVRVQKRQLSQSQLDDMRAKAKEQTEREQELFPHWPPFDRHTWHLENG